jgi:branched-chain amino acid transport system permease protein
VLVHRGTGVLTFANGEVGTAGLFLAAVLVSDLGLPWIVGALVSIAFAVLLGCLFEYLVVRRMRASDPVAIAVATVGLALFLLAAEFQIFGESPKELAGPVDGGVTIAGVIVTPTQIIGLVLALLLGFGLQAALRRTDFGLGILAAAQDPAAVRLVGVPLSRISLTIWGAGAALAAIASLLVEPTVGVFGPGYASELYVVGLAAAVIGGLNSLPGAVVGGVTLGVAEAAASRYLDDLGLSGLRYVVVLVILLAVLLGRQLLPDLLRRASELDRGTRPAGASA